MTDPKNEVNKRITIDPKVMAGKPVIKGTRITVAYIIELMADGMTVDDILNEYEGLKREDILACLQYL